MLFKDMPDSSINAKLKPRRWKTILLEVVGFIGKSLFII
jgi:hypothetical protein